MHNFAHRLCSIYQCILRYPTYFRVAVLERTTGSGLKMDLILGQFQTVQLVLARKTLSHRLLPNLFRRSARLPIGSRRPLF